MGQTSLIAAGAKGPSNGAGSLIATSGGLTSLG